MIQFTQRELLSEGFWSGFAKPLLKGAGYLGKSAFKAALPETSKNIGKTVDYGKGLRDSMLSKEKITDKKLKKMGYKMVPGSMKAHPKAKGYHIVFANSLTDVDQDGNPVDGKKSVFLVDKENNILRPRYQGVQSPQSNPPATPPTSNPPGTPPPPPNSNPPNQPPGTPPGTLPPVNPPPILLPPNRSTTPPVVTPPNTTPQAPVVTPPNTTPNTPPQAPVVTPPKSNTPNPPAKKAAKKAAGVKKKGPPKSRS